MTGRPKILLSSTFKPCGVDDLYGRRECVAEVHHNQISQHQGVYSPRYWWPTMGIHLIAANLEGCDVTVLDWPTLEQFEAELTGNYDYVGISFIHPTLGKMRKMCERVRAVAPRSKIIAGGFGVTISEFSKTCEVDYICEGEGIRFMRDLLGLSPEFVFRHPDLSCEIIEILGVPTRLVSRAFGMLGRDVSSLVNNIIITGLGCTHGCDFCCTSHFYDCRHLPFFRNGAEIYNEMRRRIPLTGSNTFFFLGDENFLSDKKRMEELWRLQRDSTDEYVIRLVFASVDQIERYDPEMLAEMNLDHIWVGLESQQFPYPKTRNRDVTGLLDALKRVGIKTILSSILFLDEHTQENLKRDVDFHLSLRPEHSQFAGLSVVEGTPLYERFKKAGRLLDNIQMEDRHAFKQIWFWHPEFTLAESEQYQIEAYQRDFHELGPGLLRATMTNARAAPLLEASSNPRLQRRGRRLREETRAARFLFRACADLADTDAMRAQIETWLEELIELCGPITAIERAEAAGVAAFGHARKFRIRHWGDTIQPRFKRTHYRF